MKKSVWYFCATSLPSCRSSSVVRSPFGSACRHTSQFQDQLSFVLLADATCIMLYSLHSLTGKVRGTANAVDACKMWQAVCSVLACTS